MQKAVLSVLAKLTSGSQKQKPAKAQREESPLSISDAIMKKCRFVLRASVSADESKRFCNLLGTTLLNSSDNNEKGMLGSPAMVSRPLDFRTIDLRLAVGAYGGSHETFLEDVREACSSLLFLRLTFAVLDRFSLLFISLFKEIIFYFLLCIHD